VDITMTECQEYTVARLNGIIDESAKATFDEYLHPIISTPGRRLLLDLSGCERINSLGIGLLVTLVSRANTKESHIVLASPTPFVSSILKVTKLTKFFEIEDAIEAAVTRLREAP